MITNLHIENFKSIENMDLPLGNLNILIGENGCGKTNILEAAAIGVAAAKDKLDNEYYFARGIRKTENRFMKSAFAEKNAKADIIINFSLESGEIVDFRINENAKGQLEESNKTKFGSFSTPQEGFLIQHFKRWVVMEKIKDLNFILYAPENTFLRKFEEEGKIEGLGFRGEGLFDELQSIQIKINLYKVKSYDAEREKLLEEHKKLNAEFKNLLAESKHLLAKDRKLNIPSRRWLEESRKLYPALKKLAISEVHFEQLLKIKAHLRELLDWFEDFEITGSNMERKLYIKDRFLPEATLFDQKSANEGFLLLLFYLTLFTGAETPTFFAIDNIDTGLNPKLGSRLIEILAKLAKEHNKQAIITTHNPAILDGLDLRDDAQRLFVVSRNKEGKTKIKRILPFEGNSEEEPVPLSEQFLRGYIGGLPLNF